MWLCFLGILLLAIIHSVRLRVSPPPDLGGEARIQGRIRKKEYRNNRLILYLKEASYSFTTGDSADNLNDENYIRMKGAVCYMDAESVSDSVIMDYKIGSLVTVRGNLESIKPATNPGEFDARKYYGARGYYYTLWNTEVVSVKGGNTLLEWLWRLRRKCADLFISRFGEENGGVLSAMLLGEKEYLAEETKDLYSLGGISHILAISGLHISLIGAFLYALLTYFPIPNKWAFVMTTVILILYGMMVGFAPSVFRAVFMFSYRLLAKNFRKSYDPPTALLLSAFLTCLVFPGMCLDSSFLLSYLAVGGILFLLPCFFPCINGKKKITDSLLAGLSIFLATLPLVLLSYHRVSFVGLILNFFVLPAMPVLFVCAFAVLVTGAVCPPLSTFFVFVAKSILYAVEWLCTKGAKCGFLTFYVKTPGVGRIVIYTTFVVITGTVIHILKRKLKIRYYELMNKVAGQKRECSGRKGEREGQKGVCAGRKGECDGTVRLELRGFQIAEKGLFVITCILMSAFCLILILTPKKFTISFLDVGQGDGIFLRTDSGKVVMIDGGSSSKTKIGEKILVPYLSYEGEREVDLWILTHRDSDHTNGFEEVLAGADIRIKRIGIPKCRAGDFEEIIQLAEEKEIDVVLLNSGDEITFSDHESIYVVSPSVKENEREPYEDANDASLAMLYRNADRDFSVAFMGDSGERAEEALENYLAESGRVMPGEKGSLQYNKETKTGWDDNIQITVLKCAHHGSANGSNSEEFIGFVHPRYAIVSCGKDNLYGHPHKEVVERIDSVGAEIFRTDYGGCITVTCARGGNRVRSFLKQFQID